MKTKKLSKKKENLPNKGWKFYKSMLFLKNESKTSENFYIYGATEKICCGEIAGFFCCVWMKNAARGP